MINGWKMHNFMAGFWKCAWVTTTTTNILRPFFQDHPGEPVPEENLWTLWCKGRLTEADTPTIWLGATPSGLTSAHLHHPPFFTGRMPFLPPNQPCQSTEGNKMCLRDFRENSWKLETAWNIRGNFVAHAGPYVKVSYNH